MPDPGSPHRSVRTRPAQSWRVRTLALVGTAALVGAGALTASALFDEPEPAPVLWVAPTARAPLSTSPTTTPRTVAVSDANPLPVPTVTTPIPTPAPNGASTNPSAEPESDPEAGGNRNEAAAAPPATDPPPPLVATTAPTTPPDTGTSDPSAAEAAGSRSAPRRLLSTRIDVDDFPVRPVGLEPDGKLEIPDETEIGWYELGAAPGEAGVTVLAAHVSWNRSLGPFAFLGDMQLGDVVTVESEDGSALEYEVVEVEMHLKSDLSQEDLWRNVGDEQLALITCGGEFDDSINRFRHNIVVIAEPVVG